MRTWRAARVPGSSQAVDLQGKGLRLRVLTDLPKVTQEMGVLGCNQGPAHLVRLSYTLAVDPFGPWDGSCGFNF